MIRYSGHLESISRMDGVTAVMTVGSGDGLIVESRGGGDRTGAELTARTAALASYLYAKAGRASLAAGLGEPRFMRLEAEKGYVCVAGSGEIVIVAVTERRVNLGRLRLEMLSTAGVNA